MRRTHPGQQYLQERIIFIETRLQLDARLMNIVRDDIKWWEDEGFVEMAHI